MSSFELPNNLDAYGLLWMAVLRQAMDDATLPLRNRDQAAARRQAREWIRSPISSPASCQWICDVLGIEAAAIRIELRKRLKQSEPVKRRRVSITGYLHQ